MTPSNLRDNYPGMTRVYGIVNSLPTETEQNLAAALLDMLKHQQEAKTRTRSGGTTTPEIKHCKERNGTVPPGDGPQPVMK